MQSGCLRTSILADESAAADRRAFGDIAHLARTHQLSSYDAAYLELAIRRGLPLACLDGKLKAAAAAGVTMFRP
jgi:predicted nucleic acid-binding protein